MTIDVDVLDSNTGITKKGAFELSSGPPYSVRLVLPTGETLGADERDYFESLATIRRQLEPRNLLVLCNGARRDVYPPTGLTRQWGGARRAYVLKASIKPRIEDAVDIFAPAERRLISSVNEQLGYFKRWFESITGHRPAD